MSIVSRNRMLALRWTYQGREYFLAVGLPDTPLNRQGAEKRRLAIATDIAHGTFDPTLAKYRPQPQQAPPPILSTVALWQAFREEQAAQGVTERSIYIRYQPLGNHLKAFGRDINSPSAAREFVDTRLRPKQSPPIVQANLGLLQRFGNWAVQQGHWEANYFAVIPKQKTPKPRRGKPFTTDEIKALLHVASTDPVCSKYRDFILFLFHTGCRPSEAIGLRWRHVDLPTQQVHICESLSRSPKGGTASHQRVRKPTKTGTERYLPMNATLVSMFAGKLAELGTPNPDDLVFLSPTGRAIDDHNFTRRIWRRLCDKAGVEYRPTYNARHTRLSHLVEAGYTFLQAAEVAGHTNARMIAETYGRALTRPPLPEY